MMDDRGQMCQPTPPIGLIVAVVVSLFVADSVLAATNPTVAYIGILPVLANLVMGAAAAIVGGVGTNLAVRSDFAHRMVMEGP